MNHHEAKFLLRAYRTDGSDAADPMFTAALAQVGRDPLLRDWLECEQSFDRAVTAKLNAVQPPAGLREAILAGGRASQPRRRWSVNPGWLAVAAAIAIVFSVTVRVRSLRSSETGAGDFAAFAMNEVAKTHDLHTTLRPELAGLQDRLANAALPLPAHLQMDGDELRRLGCRRVSFAGRETFEVCFYHGGFLYHLYVTAVDGLAPGSATAVEAVSRVASSGHFNATAWKDAKFAYALVTYDGARALRRLL
ncbi:hypothetical protein [Horticoccus sp. 23ND18S-11]|uniref:hypothetical protein n=1 Tax=Horticoccus sp. 23ND18S-11 TaxID=3391832 RepID=UPI0039C8D06A